MRTFDSVGSERSNPLKWFLACLLFLSCSAQGATDPGERMWVGVDHGHNRGDPFPGWDELIEQRLFCGVGFKRTMLGLPGKMWNVLTHLDAWHTGRNRMEFTAGIGGTIRLHIPNVLVGWAPVHEQENTGAGRAEWSLGVRASGSSP